MSVWVSPELRSTAAKPKSDVVHSGGLIQYVHPPPSTHPMTTQLIIRPLVTHKPAIPLAVHFHPLCSIFHQTH